MMRRSSSSRPRKTARQSAVSAHRSTGSLPYKSSPTFESCAGAAANNKAVAEKKDKRDKKFVDVDAASSSGARVESGAHTSDCHDSLRGNVTTVTAADDHVSSSSSSSSSSSFFSVFQYGREAAECAANAIRMNEYPQTNRGHVGYECNRPSRSSVTLDESYEVVRSAARTNSMGRKCRSSLLPDMSKSPRNSLVPEDAYNRNPRGSFDPALLSRVSRNSLFPDAEAYNRLSGWRPSMVADVTALRNSTNISLSDVSPSTNPRSSYVLSDGDRSPKGGSLVPDTNRSPRSSLMPDRNRTPRGSLIGDASNRTPRGSVTSETSAYSYNRSSRGSLSVQESCVFGKSSRGGAAAAAAASASGASAAVQFDLAARTTKGSVESVPPGGLSRMVNRRSMSPPHTGSLRKNQSATNVSVAEAAEGSRRASSSVSQVSADDRRHLCEHTKLNPEAGLQMTAYGSFVYQLNHANMESSSILDFVSRALTIVYRTAIVTILLICLTVLPLIMLIMGLEFIRDCPKEPHIPVYMIVGGCFGLMKILWLLWGQIRSLRYERLNPRNASHSDSNDIVAASVATKIGCFALTTFLISWFVCGNYWILRIYWPEHELTLFKPDNWCHRTLYVFSVVHLIIIYSILAGILLVIIVLAIIQICLLSC